MQYLKSTDSKYDKVLANIFNYIFEKEENKLNLDESTCKFDLTSLQGLGDKFKTSFLLSDFSSCRSLAVAQTPLGPRKAIAYGS